MIKSSNNGSQQNGKDTKNGSKIGDPKSADPNGKNGNGNGNGHKSGSNGH